MASQSASPFSSIEAIVFDLDDTLCGYWDASKAGLRRAFELHCPEGHTVDEMLIHWAVAFRKFAPTLKKTDWYAGYLKVGEPTRTEQMRLALAEAGIQDEALAKALSQSYMEERDRALVLFEDAIEVLEALSARFPLGLLTNGPADIQRQEVATTGVEKYFTHIMIEGELGMGKPVPEVFREAERRFGKSPEQMLMVGNSYHHDIKGAIAAGWKTAWIRRPSDVPPSVGVTELPETRPEGDPEPTFETGDLSSLLKLLLIK